MISAEERRCRDTAIPIIRAFAVGKLTNDEFESRFDANLPKTPVRRWEDPVLWRAREFLWFTYDDIRTHRLSGRHALTKEGKRHVARLILFLRSDLHYEWRTGSFILSGRTLLILLTFGPWKRLRPPAADEIIDWEIWPFRRREDLDSAKGD